MGLKRVLAGSWFRRAVLVVWIISGVSIFVLLKDIELIVHGQLYYYGLGFSPDWADPYRFYTWLIYVCLGLPMALSGFTLVLSFIKETDKVQEKHIAVEQKVKHQPDAREDQKARETNNSMVISCPNCQKVFSRPLVMLDFASGKTKLVNVCPYCNHLLSSTENEKDVNSNFHVKNVDEKLTHR
jgi:uncharacterized Zn-finger protein